MVKLVPEVQRGDQFALRLRRRQSKKGKGKSVKNKVNFSAEKLCQKFKVDRNKTASLPSVENLMPSSCVYDGK